MLGSMFLNVVLQKSSRDLAPLNKFDDREDLSNMPLSTAGHEGVFGPILLEFP